MTSQLKHVKLYRTTEDNMGGNIFKSTATSIPRDRIEPTIKAYTKALGEIFPMKAHSLSFFDDCLCRPTGLPLESLQRRKRDASMTLAQEVRPSPKPHHGPMQRHPGMDPRPRALCMRKPICECHLRRALEKAQPVFINYARNVEASPC